MSHQRIAAERCGSVAFHYGGALTAAQIDWCGRFDVLVMHDPLPAAQVAALHQRGTRLALYEWAVAFYGSFGEAGRLAGVATDVECHPSIRTL